MKSQNKWQNIAKPKEYFFIKNNQNTIYISFIFDIESLMQ